jgi:N-acetylglucosamine-6-phosphate deacetylase
MTTLAATRAFIDGRIVGPVRVTIEDATIVAVDMQPPRGGDVDLGDDLLAPGFVDLHCHGGAGGSFSSADPAALRAAVEHHRSHGTTSLVASLVSGPLGDLQAAAGRLSQLADDDLIVGVHFEGPFLSTERAGAHRHELLIDPTPEAIAGLVSAAGGHARVMTLAPERDGGLDAVAQLRELGVIPALGHSDASYELTLEAIERGVTLATHLWNGMRGVHHRAPGPIPALLDAPGVACELIVDGEHLHPAMTRASFERLGPGRVALITDAIAAAGMPDGRYELGDQAVIVKRGRAELEDGSSLAGSTLNMEAALQNAVSAGVPLEAALAASSTTPAALLGLDDRGHLARGKRADLLALAPSLRLTAVMGGGRWIVAPGP